jgi:tripartite-type tricarboxylate transporter receptor subunit TctC
MLASMAFLGPPVQAEEWPSRPMTVIIPLGAGSASDVIARIAMEQVGRQLGQPVVVENRPGAGGTIGANAVAKAAADGYTILVHGGLSTAHALYAKLPYDTLTDFIPVASLGQQPLVVVTSRTKGYTSLADLISAGKAAPGSLTFTSAGVGSASHFGAEQLQAGAGFEALHIPFKGASDSVVEIVAGRSDFSVQLTATVLPLVRDDTLVPLAVSAHARIAGLPQVPTVVECGLAPGSIYSYYTGVYLPAGTPREVVDKLNREIAKALQTPSVQARLAQLGVEPMPGSSEEFAKFFRDDVSSTIARVENAKIPKR